MLPRPRNCYRNTAPSTGDSHADEDKVVAYKEFSTGLSVNSPQKVTVLAKFYTDGSELAMEVLGGPYKDAVRDGFPKDLYSTFIIGQLRTA